MTALPSSRRMTSTARTPGWLPWALWSAAVLVSVIAPPWETGLARAFFSVVLGGGIVAVAGFAGRTPQVLVAGALLALTLLQRWPVRTVTRPPDSLWIQALAGPEQIVQHTITLPREQPVWDALWQRTATAAIWVCARGPLTPAEGLQVWLNGELVDTITEQHSSAPRPLPTSVGFFRVQVTRAQLERQAQATIQVRRAPGATERPIDVCGTFAYRPSAGVESSAFHDGRAWRYPGRDRQGRFTIELRFEDAAGQIFRTMY